MCPLLRQGESCPRGAVRADLARFRVVLRGRAKWAPGETQRSGFATERQSSGMSECTYGTETKDKEFATTRSRIKAGVAGGISGQSKLPAVRAVTGALRCIKSGVKIRRPVLPSLRSLSPNPCCHNEKQGSRSKKEQLIGRKEETASSPPPQSHLRWAALKNCAAMKQKKRFSPQDVGSEKCELFDNSSPCPWLFSFFYGMLCC